MSRLTQKCDITSSNALQPEDFTGEETTDGTQGKFGRRSQGNIISSITGARNKEQTEYKMHIIIPFFEIGAYWLRAFPLTVHLWLERGTSIALPSTIIIMSNGSPSKNNRITVLKIAESFLQGNLSSLLTSLSIDVDSNAGTRCVPDIHWLFYFY